MIYAISKNIRVRTCDEISFFVNICDNSVFCIKTGTLNFLMEVLNKKLMKDELCNHEPNFINFVLDLENNNILEVV